MAGIIHKISVHDYNVATAYRRYSLVRTYPTARPKYYLRVKSGAAGIDVSNPNYWVDFEDPNLNFADHWMPSYKSAVKSTFHRAQAQFKNGVLFARPLGINYSQQAIDCVWQNYPDEMLKSLAGYLEYKGGKDPIYFTHPNFIFNTERFTCGKYSILFEQWGISSVKAELIPWFGVA